MKLLILIALALLDEPVLQYDRIEFSPAVTTTASNPYLPYDPQPPPGVTPGAGATVDALCLAPGAAEWTVAPCFWYQPVQEFEDALLPVGEAEWRCRQTDASWLIFLVIQKMMPFNGISMRLHPRMALCCRK